MPTSVRLRPGSRRLGRLGTSEHMEISSRVFCCRFICKRLAIFIRLDGAGSLRHFYVSALKKQARPFRTSRCAGDTSRRVRRSHAGARAIRPNVIRYHQHMAPLPTQLFQRHPLFSDISDAGARGRLFGARRSHVLRTRAHRPTRDVPSRSAARARALC